jgi:hypothetical protein
MPTYDIKRWDVIQIPGKEEPLPTIYIKPDKAFENYARENNNSVQVQISGTGKQYDIGPVLGVINKSSNFRPNFGDKTGLYEISLLCNWIGYPDGASTEGEGNLGSVLIQGMEGPDKLTMSPPAPFVPPKPIEIEYYKGKDCKGCKMNPTQIIVILVILLIVFSGVVYHSMKSVKNS